MKPQEDVRNITTGQPIPKENYCDQPYVVVTKSGRWVCTLTTGGGEEGASKQHIISCTSDDRGTSWQNVLSIEPAEIPEASWVMPYLTEYGRIYVFYVYNADNLRVVPTCDAIGRTTRVDSLGKWAFKYSDNEGESWSARYYVPVRNFNCDDNNKMHGETQYFWGVGKPMRHTDGSMYFGFAKIGELGEGFMQQDEGAFIRCANIDTERDVDKLIFETLPEGKEGVKIKEGRVSDEHNLVSLSDGSLFCTFRNVAGYLACAYSRDGGRSWEDAGPVVRESGRVLKHPRAAGFVRRYSNGKYTLWCHNHGKDLTGNPGGAYYGRNPVWLCGGAEENGRIVWSEPEIVLYSPNQNEGISYPDFIEDGGDIFITETQKTVARCHKVDHRIFDAIWHQRDNREKAADGLLYEAFGKDIAETIAFPQTVLSDGGSFALMLVLDTERLVPGILAETETDAGAGVTVEVTAERKLRVTLDDGCRASVGESEVLEAPTAHITVNVDGCAGVLSFIMNGVFCDGKTDRDYGFTRLDPYLKTVSGKGTLRFAQRDALRGVRLYGRYLLTSEVIGTYRYDADHGELD